MAVLATAATAYALTRGPATTNAPVASATTATATTTQSATPTATPSTPPFTGAALLTATVPAYCTLPETQLVDGKVPEAVAGQGNGQLLLEGATAPVSLDLDGDHAPETVAAYSCGASGIAAGAHWPEMLVIYAADGQIKGKVGLGDSKLLGDTTRLVSLGVEGSGVQVAWEDTNRLTATMSRKGTLTWASGAPSFQANAIGDTVTTITNRQGTAFISPSGNILCDLDEDSVFCGLAEHQWVAPPPTNSSCQHVVYGDFLRLSLDKGAEYSCTGGVWGMGAWANNRPRGSYGPPGWFIDGVDQIVSRGSQDFYALSYGRTLKAGSTSCRLTEDGLTCENGSGHGFFVNRATAELR